MRSIVFIFCTVISGTSVIAQMKVDRKYFAELLNNGRYDQAIIEAAKLREKPYGKNAVIDYILAVGFCMRGNYDQSQNFFNHIINDYSLKKGQREFLIDERSNCSSAGRNKTVSRFPNFSYINYAPIPESGVFGKGGFTLECQDKVSSSAAGYDISELESRLYPVTQKKEALQRIREIAGKGYFVDTSGRFIVVSKEQTLDVKKVTDKLEFAYNFYLSAYHLRPSDKLISVYLVPGRSALRTIADSVHKLKLDYNTIGYSSLADLSILGIANPNSVGTLYHELFHLAVRTDVGDIPAWLDEGIASLYSVYETENGVLTGSEQTWRIQHFKLLTLLVKNKLTFPTLEQLVRMSWFEFEGGEKRNSCLSSIHYAMANMFLLFLQKNDKVYEMVHAFKNRSIGLKDSASAFADNVELLESVMSKPITAIADDFNRWIDNRYNINLVKLSRQRPVEQDRLYIETSRELPDYIVDLGSEIDSLAMTVLKQNTTRDSVGIRKIQDRKRELFNLYRRALKDYVEEYSQQNYELDRRIEAKDASDYSSDEIKSLKNNLFSYEDELKQYVKVLKEFIVSH